MNSHYWAPHFCKIGIGFTAVRYSIEQTSVSIESKGRGMTLYECEKLCKKLNQVETANTLANKVKGKRSEPDIC